VAVGLDATVTLRYVTMTDNLAAGEGAALINFGSTILSRSFVGNNRSPVTPATTGTLTNYRTLTVVNTTVYDNEGVGVLNLVGSTNVVFSTIAYHQDLDGIESFGIRRTAGVVTLQNSIVANNSVDCSGSIQSSGHNVATDASCSLSGPGDKPDREQKLQFGNFGGPINYAMPAPGSPAIDNGVCIPNLAIDQRDVARPQGAACDSGATEVRRFTLSVSVVGEGRVTSNGDPLDCPGVCSFSEDEAQVAFLNATPDSGWVFAGWSGDCQGDDCVVGFNANKSVTATFVRPGQEFTLHMPLVRR
jgi:hypothetical protein